MAQNPETIHILRDTWGVPHIYAESELGAIYGQGYAMAEDRLPTMMRAYRKAVGRMAEAFGPDWVEHDHQQRIWRHEQVARDRYGDLSPLYRRAGEAFVAGVKRYMAEHPDRAPTWALDVQPYHLVALARYVIWGWPLGQAQWFLENAPPQSPPDPSALLRTGAGGEAGTQALPQAGAEAGTTSPPQAGGIEGGADDGRGSNQWAVTARRTAGGHAITLIDPHVAWEDEWLFYESHLHGGDLDAYGFIPTGLPYIGLGHNEHISWAFTTGGPDTADVYELTVRRDGDGQPQQYRYDEEWRDLTRETTVIRVKTEEGTREVKRDLVSSHHGPVIETEGRVYAIKLAYAEAVGMFEQMAKIDKSRNLGEFLQAMAMRMMMPQNAMYGDVYGNIYYQRTGLVPIRPKGYDWTRPVPGDTSDSEWLGIHDAADLVQLLNPPAGWMQNCNISPGTMTENSPLTADRYPAYVYLDDTGRSNPRGRRANELLAAAEHVTLEEAIAIATDTYLHGEAPWRAALLAAYEAGAAETNAPLLRQAIDILRAWDGHADKDTAGMTLFRAWWHAIEEKRADLPLEAIERGEALSEDVQETLIQGLDEVAQDLARRFGRLDVPWGRVYRARRGDQSWPVDGVAEWADLVTLRAVHGAEPDAEGVSYIESGQSCTTVVMLKRGDVRSYSAVPYGQSEDPDSPHYTDQGRLLGQERKLKDSWFRRKRLEGHVESEQTLTVTW
jgi:acyl-homoserine-lactone acylase